MLCVQTLSFAFAAYIFLVVFFLDSIVSLDKCMCISSLCSYPNRALGLHHHHHFTEIKGNKKKMGKVVSTTKTAIALVMLYLRASCYYRAAFDLNIHTYTRGDLFILLFNGILILIMLYSKCSFNF